MNHAELSRDLALAIGYYPESVKVIHQSYAFVAYSRCDVYRNHMQRSDGSLMPVWVTFDYRSPDVCLPLLKWLMEEHDINPLWSRSAKVFVLRRWSDQADTLEEAIARACIAVGVK
jgi:hypothetical protein